MAFNPRSYFDSNPYTIEDFLNKQSYEVPENQRCFSWEKENFERLWDDIVSVLNDNLATSGLDLKTVNELKPFFLGAVVLEKTNDLLPARIIDGQQRLITISILLSVLYEYANKISDPTVRSSLTGVVYPLFTSSIGGQLRNPKIKIAKDKIFYNDIIVQRLERVDRELVYSSLHDTQKSAVKMKIYECYSLYYEKLNYYAGPVTDTNYAKKLELLIRVVLKLLTVLELEVKDESVAYKVFETLNERGLDLTQADLIKNEVIKTADAGGLKSQAIALWNDIEVNLSDNPEEVNNFFRHFYISKHGVIKAQDTFDKIKYQIKNGQNVISFCADAKSESELYYNLINTCSLYTNDTNEAIKNIKTLNITYAYPLLLSASVKFTNINDLEKAIKSIRDFCFRYITVGGGSPDSLAKILEPISISLRGQGYGLHEMMNALHSNAPDTLFVDNFKSFSPKNGATAFYVLKAIEDKMAGGQGVQVLGQSSTQHLEHIMPKKPTASDWGHVVNDERYNMYLNKIGNLLVLEKNINSHIKNKGYNYKYTNNNKYDYKNSVLRLPAATNGFLNNGLWDFTAINDRQNYLSTTHAVNVWPVKY